MLEKELLKFVSERANVNEESIGIDSPLFSDGLLDSMAVLEVSAFVEKLSGVQFEIIDISLENLDSISRILSFVASRSAR